MRSRLDSGSTGIRAALLFKKRLQKDRKILYFFFTGFQRPFTYLGVPISTGHVKKVYFNELVEKIRKRITGWKAKMLSAGGKKILIKHVLAHTLTFGLLSP